MTHPEFLPWDRPALPEAARLLAERRAADGNLDLGDLVVVLPAARAGRRLVEILVDEAERRGVVLLPPVVTTIGALPERLYEPPRPLADETLSRRTWSRALRSLDSEARSTVLPEPPTEDDLPGWDRIARLVHGLHREIAAEGLEFADVARTCRETGAGTEADRWRTLAAAQRAYHDRLRALDRIDRDAARLEALDAGTIEAETELWLVGVVEMPGVTRRMLEIAASDASPVSLTPLVHAPEDRAEGFDELGCVRTDVWKKAEIAVPDSMIIACGRPPSQADAALRCLADGGRKLAPDEVTVGVPDREVVPYLEQRFDAYGVPHRYAAGTPLEKTGPFHLLEAVADYLESRRFDDLAALLRHPRIEDLVDHPAPLDVADRHFERCLPARVARDPEPDEGPGRAFAEVQYELHEVLELRRFGGDATPGTWMHDIMGLLERIYADEPLDRSNRTDRRLIEALETFREAAASIHALPAGAAEDREEIGGAAAIRLLLAEVREATLPPLPDRGAVEMLGWLELHLDDAPVLVITGFDDDHVPGSVAADLFLPGRLRSRLGLPDNDDRYARDACLLSAMLASREELHVVVGRRDAEGDPLRPSRLLLSDRGEKLARRARRLFADETPSPPPLPRLGLRAEGDSDFRTPPEPVIRIADPPVDLRVTDFRLLIQDPYRWALERELGLRALDDRARELDGGGFGSLAHRVLHQFGADPAVAASDDPEIVRERLDDLLDATFRRRFGPDVLPAVRLQVEQLRARLREFAVWQAERAAAGWRIAAAEIDGPEDGVPFEVDGTPVRLHGRIDRIDRHPATGRWAVLDYKTSDPPSTPDQAHRHGRGRDAPWTDLQLPLYRHLVSALAGSDRAGLQGLSDRGVEIELGYVNLSREGVELATADWTDDELAAADEAARRTVRTLRAGEFVFREDDFLTYRDDPFAPLLGKRRLVAAGLDPESDDPAEDGDSHAGATDVGGPP